MPDGMQPKPEDNKPMMLEDTVKHRALLDDVPVSFKKPRVQEIPVGLAQLPHVALFAVKAKDEDKWLDTRCLGGLSRLLGRRVLGAKVHARSRSELFDHPGHRHNRRLSVMMTKDSDRGATLKDDEASGRKGSPKMKLAWEVLAVFYVAGVAKQIYFPGFSCQTGQDALTRRRRG